MKLSKSVLLLVENEKTGFSPPGPDFSISVQVSLKRSRMLRNSENWQSDAMSRVIEYIILFPIKV